MSWSLPEPLARRVLLLTLIASPSLTTSCSGDPPLLVTDSFTPPSEPFVAPQDVVHDYVPGTTLKLDVRARRAFLDLDEVAVVSKSPGIVAVDGQRRVDDRLVVTLTAHAPGTAALVFVDKAQRPLEERVLEVVMPDAIRLTVNIDTDEGFTVPTLETNTLLLAAGGSATFRVRYEKNGAEVKGVSVLEGQSDVVHVENPTVSAPDREFIKLTAPKEATPAAAVLLRVAGQVVRTLEVRTASLGEIKAVELDTGEDEVKWNGTTYPVWAKAFDADAVPIFGSPFAWSFDGDAVEGAGDLLRYEHAGGERRRIQVKAGDVVEDLTVEAKASTAAIESTADPGCSQSRTPSGTWIALFGLLGVLARRTRRPPGAWAGSSPPPSR